MIKSKNITNQIFIELEKAYSFIPLINKLNNIDKNPFRVLITIMLSARTKDETTEEVSDKLFSVVKTAEDIIKIPTKNLEKLIYKSGFYKVKAKHIKDTAKIIYNKYNNKIPNTIEELIKLPGVGLKTASLYLIEVENQTDICVDTHVHRISNRLGLINTKTAKTSYYALKKTIDKKHWRSINRIMVSFGKTICKPIGPKCKICKLKNYCNFNLFKESNK